MADDYSIYKTPKEEKQKHPLGARERRLLVALAAAILIIVALALSSLIKPAISPSGPSSSSQYGPQSCAGYIYPSDYYNCINLVAIKTDNANACSTLPAVGRDNCLYGLAKNKSDISICSQINQTTQLYYECLGSLLPSSMDLNYCSTLAFPISSQCIYNLSVKSNFTDLAACSSITNTVYSTSCSSLYYYEKALSTKSATYCGSVKASKDNIVLYTLTVNGSTDSLLYPLFSSAFSRSLALNLSPNGYCNYQLALSTNDSSLCSNLPGNTLAQNSCIASFEHFNVTNPLIINFNASNVTAACKATKFTTICHFSYFTNRALTLDNVTYCQQLNASNGLNLCVRAFVLKYRNTAYCSYITNSSLRAVCLNYTIFTPSNLTNFNLSVFNTTGQVP